ncbi:MAG: DUF2975 domain-containing protein [Chitinophagales bacterium]|nr:DUF2975 domain-containing protein [Chitinophagales bacterium]
METKKDYLLIVLHILSWIIFVGLCIEAGGFLFNTLYTLFYNSAGAANFWMKSDLSAVFNFSQSHFITLTAVMVIASVLKAILFYVIVKLFHDKKLDLSAPFNESFGRGLYTLSYLTAGISLFTFWGTNFSGFLIKEGVALPSLQELRFAGADVWLFMCVTLLVFARIFKKGITIQNENQLTI